MSSGNLYSGADYLTDLSWKYLLEITERTCSKYPFAYRVSVRFVGIDLAWKCVDQSPWSTAVCVIDEDGIAEIELVTGDEEILAMIGEEVDCLVGIDASLTVPNQTGMRSTEKLVRAMGIQILPTSRIYLREKFGGSRGELLVDALCLKGFAMAGPHDRPGRLIYEVFPYSSVRSMMGGPHRYKHGRLVEKKQGCIDLFETIRDQNPQVRFPEGLLDDIDRVDSADMKSIADKIDSMLCSISLYRHAIYRGQTTQMIGDEDNGFILLCR
jgi:predicted RNase H-like nuclease